MQIFNHNNCEYDIFIYTIETKCMFGSVCGNRVLYMNHEEYASYNSYDSFGTIMNVDVIVCILFLSHN